MGIVAVMSNKFSVKPRIHNPQLELLDFLKDLQALESKLWGVMVVEVQTGEEKIVEDVNHLVYALNTKSEHEMGEFLHSRDFAVFKKDLENMRKDFLALRNKIKKRETLKNLITAYTIKLVDEQNYMRLEKIFLLEKQLNDVIDKQDEEFLKIISDVKTLKFGEHDRVQKFLDTLKQLRSVLGGHLDHHDLWEEERQGYSNVSNIVHSLKKAVAGIN